ncbi:hypothetical protein CAL29_10825 [Bordetella genomosp. 10]|uniref:DUF3579 domain-containing protein n=1 Tax=Bordetella genomosp. 10 TaxID=1416804 RepID=A0A261SA61_9BORD|nr:DUF3579 domain-containing protein [Bordetella genomosp. 10]OZI34045.1 hypothetical protein CAL29_10825 [Bordetella genomosp. 10]
MHPVPGSKSTVFRVRQLFILGVTEDGHRFRPSDWAERLAGVMAQFRPPGMAPSHITYSPYVLPVIVDGNRSVVVDERLRELEPLAWKFVVDFARDNRLQTKEHDTDNPASDAPA